MLEFLSRAEVNACHNKNFEGMKAMPVFQVFQLMVITLLNTSNEQIARLHSVVSQAYLQTIHFH